MENIIFDYDGTLTDNHSRAKSIKGQFFRKLINDFNAENDYLIKIFNSAKREILKDDINYPYIANNEVACYCEDELIFNDVCLKKALRENCREDFIKFEKNNASLFHDAYQKTSPVFFGGLADFLKKISGKNVYVISNSETGQISRELKTAGIELLIKGNAKKYFVKSGSVESEDKMSIGKRTINLDRPFYRDALKDFEPENSLVVGDNFSLDLSLPLSLGFDVALIKNRYNAWAAEYLKSIGKKAVGNVCELIV
jgi:FMN phosphatase YigB (HAD superfamily)